MQLDTAGWYSDPRDRYHGRFFDGKGWTSHVCTADYEQLVDPLGIAPHGASSDELVAGDLQSARRLAVYDQQLLRRARLRSANVAVGRGPFASLREHPLAGVTTLLVPVLVLALWFGFSAGSDVNVVTKLLEPRELAIDEAPVMLAFTDREAEIAMTNPIEPAWSDVAEHCYENARIVRVAQSTVIDAGRYRVGLCDGVLTFRNVSNLGTDTGRVDTVTVGKDAFVMADGTVVSWQRAPTSGADDAQPLWDITFWGGERGVSTTVRVPSVFDDHAQPRPPLPLPGGYVLSVPVDDLHADDMQIERPAVTTTAVDA